MAKRDSFLLRLSPAMMEALRRWSEDEFRSMNSQIEMVLVRALREAGRDPAKLINGSAANGSGEKRTDSNGASESEPEGNETSNQPGLL